MKPLADPTQLKPIDKKDGLVQVIIETPAGSRNKFGAGICIPPDQGCAKGSIVIASESNRRNPPITRTQLSSASPGTTGRLM